MKRITLILWLLLSTTVWTFAYDFQSGDLYYNITSDSTATVTYQKYNPSDNYSGLTSAIIPESVTYNGTTYRVTSIGISAFEHCSGLTSVTIPNSVTSIGSGAFYSCSGLTSITIPNSVTSIGNVAFGATPWYNNQSNGVFYINNVLYSYIGTMPDNTSIAVKEGTVSISPYAFQHCSGLTSVTIPNSVTSIGGYVFYECSGLTSVIIPNGVTSIGEYAFYGCSGLTSVIIPNGVTSIGEYAFYECSGLTSVTIGNSVTSIGGNAFNGCKGLTSVVWNAKSCHSISFPKQITSFTFGDDVEYIPKGLCSNMTGLTSITIPKSVTSIERGVFEGCSGLTSVVWNAKSCKVVDQYSPVSQYNAPFYYNRSRITSFVFGDEVKHIPAYLCYEMSNLTSIAIPNSVTSIGEGAFSDCTGLTSVTIPDNVTWIGESAFSDCSGLTSITITDGVTAIKYGTFSGCSSLTSVTIPNSVTSIGKSAFSGCSGLASVTIPNNVTSIGGGAFSGCNGLTSITIPNSVTSIEWSAFSGCSSLTSITIPTSVTSIGNSAFSGCNGLTSITIPNSVTSIGGYAFEYCSSLTSITIPNSMTSIGRSAFFGCGSLTSVTWNAKNYADCTSGATPFYYSNRSGKDFDLRSQITSFIFGDSVQHIPAYICNGMDKLVSITIGKDVMSIGNYALAGCTSLTHVKWNAPNYTATNPFYCESVGDTIGFDLRSKITSFVCGDSVYAITPGICYQMTNLDTLACPAMALESEDVNMENYPKALKYVKLLNGEFTETIQSILSGSRKTIRTLDLDNVSNTEIPDEAFREFYKMDTLVLPAQLTKIPYKAVSECVALQSIVVPEGVTEIEYGAFSGCSGLQTLTLPSTLQSIADNGFASCSALQEMRVHAQTPPTVFANTFSGVKRTIPVYVPQSAYNDYTAAEVWKEFFIQSDVADSVENTPANDTCNQDVRKVLRNGQVYILRGDKTYTLTGEEL